MLWIGSRQGRQGFRGRTREIELLCKVKLMHGRQHSGDPWSHWEPKKIYQWRFFIFFWGFSWETCSFVRKPDSSSWCERRQRRGNSFPGGRCFVFRFPTSSPPLTSCVRDRRKESRLMTPLCRRARHKINRRSAGRASERVTACEFGKESGRAARDVWQEACHNDRQHITAELVTHNSSVCCSVVMRLEPQSQWGFHAEKLPIAFTLQWGAKTRRSHRGHCGDVIRLHEFFFPHARISFFLAARCRIQNSKKGRLRGGKLVKI